MRVPVEVRGTSDNGSLLEETTYTAVVGVDRAMILTSRMLQMGSEVAVTNRFSQQTAVFRAVWVNDRKGVSLWEIGIESLRPLDDFWGVRFHSKSGAR